MAMAPAGGVAVLGHRPAPPGPRTEVDEGGAELGDGADATNEANTDADFVSPVTAASSAAAELPSTTSTVGRLAEAVSLQLPTGLPRVCILGGRGTGTTWRPAAVGRAATEGVPTCSGRDATSDSDWENREE